MKFTRVSSVPVCGVVFLLVALVIVAALPHAAVAQVELGDFATELADLDRRLEEAAVKGDADLLARHLGDDFSFTHVEGTTETKSDYLSRARRIPGRYFFARDVSHQVVEIHGDVGLVVGRLDIRGFGPRADLTKARQPVCSAIEYVHLYARRDRQWTFVSTEQLIWSSKVIRAPRNGTLADAAGLAPGRGERGDRTVGDRRRGDPVATGGGWPKTHQRASLGLWTGIDRRGADCSTKEPHRVTFLATPNLFRCKALER
jgi:hypothetical protein